MPRDTILVRVQSVRRIPHQSMTKSIFLFSRKSTLTAQFENLRTHERAQGIIETDVMDRRAKQGTDSAIPRGFAKSTCTSQYSAHVKLETSNTCLQHGQHRRRSLVPMTLGHVADEFL